MQSESLGLRALEWLLTYGVHSTVLLGGAWLLATRPFLRSERVRERIWKTAIVGGVLTALVQVGAGIEPFGGRFRLASPASVATVPAKATPEWEHALPSAGPAEHVGFSPEPWAPAGESFAFGPLETDFTGAPLPAGDETPLLATSTVRESSARAPLTWTQWVLTAWLAVGALLLLVLAGAHRRLRGRLAGTQRIDSGPLLGLLALVRRRAGLLRPVHLAVSPRLEAPIAMGTLFTKVCIPPRALSELSTEMQESMLAHEVAHIARFDPLWLGLCRLLETVFFFQPLNRVARKRLQECSEFLCDDLAVEYTGNRIDLARCLAEVAGWILRDRRAIPACGMADLHSPLGERIERILDADAQAERRASWLAPAGASLLSATVLVAPSFSFAEPRTDRAAEEAFLGAPELTFPAGAAVHSELPVSTSAPVSPIAAAEDLLATFAGDLGALDVELASIRHEALELGAPAALLADVEILEQEVRDARTRNERIRELLAILSLSVEPDLGGATAPQIDSASPRRDASDRSEQR